jgi:Mg2+/Co2+ transporter CorB
MLLPTHNDEHDLSPSQRVMFMVISVGLVISAGLMSGLTLGLMSMDLVELEVLKRSGTQKEQKYAAVIAPIVSNQHFLLVTLLLCNACAMEALPLFLDRLADPVTAILISVTAVLVFGEVLPQAVCSRWVMCEGNCASYSSSTHQMLSCMQEGVASVPILHNADAVRPDLLQQFVCEVF